MINALHPTICCRIRLSVFVSALAVLSACSILQPANSPPPLQFSFDNAPPPVQVVPSPKSDAPSILVSVPRAAAGFDGHQIIFTRQLHQLEYFRLSEWIDTPANMLTPLIVTALAQSGQFSAVIQAPTSAVTQLRLDVEIVRLQQEFFSQPSQAHFTLRAHLLDATTRQIVAWREFDVILPASSDTPYGGVVAANSAVRKVVTDLVTFCAQALHTMPAMHP